MNNQFIQEAINGDEVRKIIAENYNEVLKEEGIRNDANRKSLALKMNQDIERITRGPPPLRERKVTDSAKKKKELDNGQARARAAASMKDLNLQEENTKENPVEESASPRIVKKQDNLPKVQDLLRSSNENALNTNNKDLDKMFHLQLPALDVSDRQDGQIN